MHRREMLGAAMAGALTPFVAATAQAPAPPAAPAPPSERLQRIVALAAANRRRLDRDGATFAGPAWDWVVARGRQAQFFLLGEEHGIAENPRFAAALFVSLAPAGYDKLCVEISPPMATVVDRAVTAGGMDGLRRLFADEGSNVAFFGLREEAELLAAVRAAVPGGRPFLWGCDYEVGADRRLIAMLAAKPKPAAARTALATLEAASTASWRQYHATHNPQLIYSFAGDPALVRAVRAAWPQADTPARTMLTTLEETFEINRLWVAGQYDASNQRRAAFLRANFLTYWRGDGGRSRVFMKFGAAHLQRGLNGTGTFDLGTLAPELAAAKGNTAFQLLVLADPASETANLDPQSYTYRPGHRGQYQGGMKAITGAAWPDAFTLIDTAPLRPLAEVGATDVPASLVRAIHGFDAILVLSGSTPSHPL